MPNEFNKPSPIQIVTMVAAILAALWSGAAMAAVMKISTQEVMVRCR